jgi:NAD(P)-dependent dehydrogenase (short-subunit alcohol dehydrogenase family)
LKLKHKVVVVTGAGSGMGREVVQELLARGARVAAVDMREETLQETASLVDAGDRLSLHVVDVTDRAAVGALPEAVEAHHGVVDGLVHCAGIIQPFVRLGELDYDVIDRVIQVNLYGTIHMVKAFLPRLQLRPESHIANISSMGGFLPVPGQAMYGATKAAVKLMTEALYAELMETKVGVSVVMPGAVATNITTNSGVDIPEPDSDGAGMAALPAADAARIILDGIEHDRLYILVGNDAKLMWFAERAAPKQAIHLIQRQMKALLPDVDET